MYGVVQFWNRAELEQNVVALDSLGGDLWAGGDEVSLDRDIGGDGKFEWVVGTGKVAGPMIESPAGVRFGNEAGDGVAGVMINFVPGEDFVIEDKSLAEGGAIHQEGWQANDGDAALFRSYGVVGGIRNDAEDAIDVQVKRLRVAIGKKAGWLAFEGIEDMAVGIRRFQAEQVSSPVLDGVDGNQIRGDQLAVSVSARVFCWGRLSTGCRGRKEEDDSQKTSVPVHVLRLAE